MVCCAVVYGIPSSALCSVQMRTNDLSGTIGVRKSRRFEFVLLAANWVCFRYVFVMGGRMYGSSRVQGSLMASEYARHKMSSGTARFFAEVTGVFPPGVQPKRQDCVLKCFYPSTCIREMSLCFSSFCSVFLSPSVSMSIPEKSEM